MTWLESTDRPAAHDQATPDAGLLTRLRRRFDQGVAVGISTNLSRPWPKGNHRVQGCWRTLATLQRHCRIRSYLVSARNHGRRPIDAIHDALTANPWMPPQAA